MNLDPQNYVALLDSIIRTNPNLLDTIRSILKAYLKLDPYEDLLRQMDAKLQATLVYIIQDINEIENPFTLEQEVYFLLEHLNQLESDVEGGGDRQSSEAESHDGISYLHEAHDDEVAAQTPGKAKPKKSARRPSPGKKLAKKASKPGKKVAAKVSSKSKKLAKKPAKPSKKLVKKPTKASKPEKKSAKKSTQSVKPVKKLAKKPAKASKTAKKLTKKPAKASKKAKKSVKTKSPSKSKK